MGMKVIGYNIKVRKKHRGEFTRIVGIICFNVLMLSCYVFAVVVVDYQLTTMSEVGIGVSSFALLLGSVLAVPKLKIKSIQKPSDKLR